MKIPELETFCWCISLRTGVKVVGFASIVGCLFTILVTAWELVLVIHYEPYGFEGFVITGPIDILTQVVQVAASVSLLLGVYQGKAQFLLPWLVTTVLNVVLEILFARSIVHMFTISNVPSLSTKWILVNVASIIDDVYGWFVVYSYYRTITPPPTIVV